MWGGWCVDVVVLDRWGGVGGWCVDVYVVVLDRWGGV